MINIYNFDGSILLQVPITENAKWERDLSTCNYIQLPFNDGKKRILPAGSYIVHTYYIDSVRKVTRRFVLLDPYEPEQADEMSWKYAPEFQHPEMILGRVPFYINTKNSQNEDIKQTNFPYVDTITNCANLITKFLNDELKLENCGWTVVLQNVSAYSIKVEFNDLDFRSALTAICNAIGKGCEWHIDYDNEVIYLGNVVINVVYGDVYITEDGKTLNKNTETLCSIDYKQPKNNKHWDIETYEKVKHIF